MPGVTKSTACGTGKDGLKELPAIDLIAKAVALLPQTNSVLKDMKGEDVVNLIAKQAQNVQEDGSVSDLQTQQEAYDSAVRIFDKQLVDAAIKANPLFSFLLRRTVNTTIAFDSSLQANIISTVGSDVIKKAIRRS